MDRRTPDRGPKPPKPDIAHKGPGVLVLNKPAGIPVRGDDTLTLRDSVLTLAFARRERMKPWHTIDSKASGAVAFVTGADRSDLAVPESRPEVSYLALVEGVFDETVVEQGTSISAPIEGSKGNPVSHLRVVDSGNGVTLVLVRARPDVPGQVRQHLASIGHPVVGDHDCGATRDDLARVALHSYELRFRELEEQTVERVRVPAPAGWWRVLGTTPPSGMAAADDQQAESNRDKGWGEVAGWYDELISTRGSDHHDRLILPGVVRLTDLQPHEKLLDMACGQGAAARFLIERCPGATALGVDVSEALIERAKGQSPESIDYRVGDATQTDDLGLEGFDAAVCVLALMNIDPIDPVFEGLAKALKPGGRAVSVILHPAYRNPGSTAWGWTHDERSRDPVQYRRVDQYLSASSTQIVMNPGAVSKGEPAITTMTHHRPIGAYIQSAARAGLVIDAMEEWASDRKSEPGPRARAEDTARREIPMFLAFRAIKPSDAS